MKRNFITRLTAVLLVLLLVSIYPVSAAAASTVRNAAIVYVPDMNSIALYEITPDMGMKIGTLMSFITYAFYSGFSKMCLWDPT